MVTNSSMSDRIITTASDLCFTDFNDLRNHWNILSTRNVEAHDKILDSIVNGNLTLLDKGFSKRRYTGKLSEQGFNLLDEYTWNTCTCSQMTNSAFDSDRYVCTNTPCGKERYCPRCAFRNEQTFYKKYSPYWNSRTLDFYHVTFCDSSFHYFNCENRGTLFESFHHKLNLIHKKLGNIQSGRTRWDWMAGSIWNEEAACIDLTNDKWSSHIHVIIACPKGSEIDLQYFSDMDLDIDIKRICTKSHYDNCLRYMCKPIHETLRRSYAAVWSPDNSRLLYRKVRESMEVLRELFKKRKMDTTGYFRSPLSSSFDS